MGVILIGQPELRFLLDETRRNVCGCLNGRGNRNRPGTDGSGSDAAGSGREYAGKAEADMKFTDEYFERGKVSKDFDNRAEIIEIALIDLAGETVMDTGEI